MDIICDSERKTNEIANKISMNLDPPFILSINGELGSGKTVIARSIIQAQNNREIVKSPTFSLVEEYIYPGIKIYHIDLYRLTYAEIVDLTIQDYISDNSVLIIEWAEKYEEIINNSDIIIDIDILDSKTRNLKIAGNSESGKKVLLGLEK